MKVLFVQSTNNTLPSNNHQGDFSRAHRWVSILFIGGKDTIKPARLIVFASLFSIMILAAACAPAKPDPNAAKPSNAGGTGSAITLTGDAAKGKTIFATRCIGCHGEEGKGGIANDGSDDGTVPPLNPIDSTVVNKDKKVFAANLDLFLQNGSTPEGSKPAKSMLPFGSTNLISQQDIADVIAYIISLNPVQ